MAAIRKFPNKNLKNIGFNFAFFACSAVNFHVFQRSRGFDVETETAEETSGPCTGLKDERGPVSLPARDIEKMKGAAL